MTFDEAVKLGRSYDLDEASVALDWFMERGYEKAASRVRAHIRAESEHRVACGICGSRNTDAEFVGVGFVQATPAECMTCGAREFYDGPPFDGLSKEELRAGWTRRERFDRVEEDAPDEVSS